MITCNTDKSCSVSLHAYSDRYPGEIHYGVCDNSGNCGQYPEHCQNCYDFCQTKQRSGEFDTAIITVEASNQRSTIGNQRRQDPGNYVIVLVNTFNVAKLPIS